MGSSRILLPRIFPILDSSMIPKAESRSRRDVWLDRLGQSLADAGVWLMEYRNKTATDAEVLADARVLRAAMPWAELVMDDRVDIALAAGFNGAHVDAGDLPPADARSLLGDERIVGTSAGSEAQLLEALAEPVDYVAFGPVFPTTTKQTTAAPIGIEGVRRFRAAAGPEAVLVAAAGISLETAPEILAAGATSVAVASAIFRSAAPAEEFRRWAAVLT